MAYSSKTIYIPLQDSADEMIELDLNELSTLDFKEVFDLLRGENAQLKHWIAVALEYYKRGRVNDFVSLMEYARCNANDTYPDYDRDLLRTLDLLAFHYLRQANKERNKDEKNKLFDNVYKFLNIGDKIALYDQNHLVGKAFLTILRGDRMDQANANFTFVLNQFPNHTPALLGKACILFNRRDYKGALAYYKRILRHNPRSPAAVRVGIGHCFLRLGHHDRAMDAFERALELDPQCVGALVGVGISRINRHEIADIRTGINILSKVCSLDPTNPMALNHLANHFFFKKDYKKSNELAWSAFSSTENEAIRAESCYQIARIYHVQGNYDQAFQYYYRATQSTSPNFTLPHYGLGQMYLQRNDIENAAQCFERVLKVQPTNYETMKILGSLYANSTSQSKREIAKNYLKKVTETTPDDFESWIELAQILEQSDLKGSLQAYDAGCKIIRDTNQTKVPPEILNNMSVLKYRLNNLEDSREEFSEALALCKSKAEQDPSYYNTIAITITYNLSRVNEALCRSDLAETLYKDILKEHPNYFDCYLRLGCMARDKNNMYEASEWFKEALRVDSEHPDVWSLLGNLHLSKCEWGPAQNKFDRILKNHNREDSYSLVALGNIWLQTLYPGARPAINENRRKVLEERALSQYVKVLRNDPQNIWAANGIGCVLAYKRCINEARDVFAQVREATSEFCDVWLNIAHIYLEQKQYSSAIQMYESCMKKFFKHHDVKILKYLGRAYYRDGRFQEAKTIFLKAQKVAPYDTTILYNVALVSKHLATQIFQDEKSNLEDVLQANRDLELSHRYFKYLSVKGDRMLFDLRLAELEAKQCQDLESQAKYHVNRARKIDEEEKEMRKKQEEEIVNFRLRQLKERLKAEESQRRQKADMQQKRQEYVEKTKGALIFEAPMEKKSTKGRGRGRDLTLDADSDGSPSEPKSTQQKKSKTNGVCNGKKRGRKPPDDENSTRRSSTDSDKPKPKRRRKTKVKEAKVTNDDGLTAKQRMRIVSKAFVSSSDSDGDSSTDSDKRKSKRGKKAKVKEAKVTNAGLTAKQKQMRIASKKALFSSSSSDSDGDKLIIAYDSQRSCSVSSRSSSRSGSRSRSRSRSYSRSFSRSTSRSRSRSSSKTQSRSRSRSSSVLSDPKAEHLRKLGLIAKPRRSKSLS